MPRREGRLALFHLSLSAAAQAFCASLLSPEEHERASRRRDPLDRQYFVAARGLVRHWLGQLTGQPAAGLRFQPDRHGKPALLPGPGFENPPVFNLSHSGPWLLLGVVDAGRIGVDLELPRPLHDRDALVRRYFSPAECRAYAALPEELRQAHFFQLWAAKEAFVKALGLGLRFPLHAFDVTLGAGETLRIGAVRPAAGQGAEALVGPWWLGASAIFSGVATAVALDCNFCTVFAAPAA